MHTWVKRLAVASTIGMFIVLMLGSTVTNTGSAEGCGRSWPLCHGEFIPEYAVQTAIEFTHRIVTALEGLLLFATCIGALWGWRGRRDVKILVAVVFLTLVLQSGLGAMAVLWPQTPAVLATHFGISMTCFAAVFLLTRTLFEPTEPAALAMQAAANETRARLYPLPGWFNAGVWVALVGSIVVAYIGAYMRHSRGELACYRWPTCTDEILPGFDGPVGVALAHRFLAAALMALVVALAVAARKRAGSYPALSRACSWAVVFITLQALAGGAVVLTGLDLWTTLAHSAFMALLFVCLSDACMQMLKMRRTRKPDSISGTQPVAPGLTAGR